MKTEVAAAVCLHTLGTSCTRGVSTPLARCAVFAQVALLPEHAGSCSGCAHIVRPPEQLRRCSANRACVLVLVQSPAAPEGELKAKPIWICLVLAEAIKGKVQAAAVSGAGSMWHTVGYSRLVVVLRIHTSAFSRAHLITDLQFSRVLNASISFPLYCL